MKFLFMIFMLVQAFASPLVTISKINQIRNKFNQVPITYDYGLEHSLENFSTNGSWYYSDSGLGSYFIPSINRTRSLNKDFLMTLPQFRNYRNDNWTYLFSDTTNYKKYPVSFIFQYRINQLDCFDFKKCSYSSFNEYTTCLKGGPELNGVKHCSFAYSYLPKLLNENLISISCILLKFISPYTPSNQPLSFACYQKLSDLKLVDSPF